MPAPSRILVPVDLSDGSQALIDYAIQLAKPFNATIEVIHAWEPPQYVAPDLLVAAPGWNSQSLEQVAVDAATKELNNLVSKASGTATPIKHRVVVGEAASTVLRLAEEGKHDLIIMGTHGRRGLPRLLLGSVAQKIVARAHCPVLTVHLYEADK
ncbi:universal stress protein [Hyalangium minutum]|uniref:Universal stress protein n=1 Tax=Hyalangium minutum TaxID=394096 RepID=A0A085WS52_9BACT|nr:universal stress protein [Hyalangium minutum]KFE70515.1 Universal stress protein family protein [Hyalangium minutum]